MAQIIELNREYIKGVHAAKMAVATGDVFDLDDALYHAGLLQVYRQQKGLTV